MKPSSAKAKGRNLQNWTVEKILSLFTHLEKDDVRSTSMGVTGEDIQLSPKARKCFPYAVEAKSRNKIAVYPWIEQADSNKKNYTSLLIVKGNHKDPLAIMYADELLAILKENYDLKTNKKGS